MGKGIQIDVAGLAFKHLPPWLAVLVTIAVCFGFIAQPLYAEARGSRTLLYEAVKEAEAIRGLVEAQVTGIQVEQRRFAIETRRRMEALEDRMEALEVESHRERAQIVRLLKDATRLFKEASNARASGRD